MGVAARMKDIARKKGMKTAHEVESENLEKLNDTKKPTLNYFLKLKSKNIVLALLNGEIYEGVLKSFNSYEACIETTEIPEIIVFKHAIKYMHEKQKED